MSYLVNKTNGELLATILDGQTNTTSSSIVLIGKQVTGYGETQNENFLHILENFANSIDPFNPLAGQLWWDTANKVMKAFDGAAWRPVSGFTSAASSPVGAYIGDQWWDTVNDQFKVYNGTEWVLVGPAYSKLDSKSGALVENIVDTLNVSHTVLKIYHNGNVTAVFSRDPVFTPNVALAGFSSIRPGLSFTSAVDAIKLYGTATNSDTVGNIAASQFLRSDIDSSTTSTLSVGGQLKVGQNNELNFSVNGVGQATIKNDAVNQSLYIRANVGGLSVPALTVDGTSGLVTVYGAPVATNGIVSKGYLESELATVGDSTVEFIQSNVALLTNADNLINANIVAINSQISNLSAIKANIASPAFTGTPTAPTPAPGDNSTKLATTAFIANAISSFDTTRIYNQNSQVVVGSTNVQLIVNGSAVLTATSSGVALPATPAQNNNSTQLATTAYADRADKNYVRNSVRYQPTCYVSDQVPNNSIGVDGDLWFQYV